MKQFEKINFKIKFTSWRISRFSIDILLLIWHWPIGIAHGKTSFTSKGFCESLRQAELTVMYLLRKCQGRFKFFRRFKKNVIHKFCVIFSCINEFNIRLDNLKMGLNLTVFME